MGRSFSPLPCTSSTSPDDTAGSVPAVPDYAADLALAQQLADDAETLTMVRFLAADLRVETKPDLTPVTDADTAVEQLLRRRLESERPHDAVLGEEFGTTPGDVPVGGPGGRRWVLDPIDGTKNFVRGVPVWATLVALMEDDEVVVGVVAAPALGRRWWAARGAGAHTGGSLARSRRLQVSAIGSVADASLSHSDHEGWGDRLDAFRRLQADVWRNRAYGDFWSHVLVAEGAVDVAVEPDLGAWDVAALVPVVTEAGGRVTSLDGGPAVAGGSAVTTNGVLHDEVVARLAT
jgi:histidinol-phosphatase